MSRRYAETTQVSVARSQAEVQDILEKYGIERIGIVKDKGQALLWFTYQELSYKLTVPIPDNCKNPEQELKRAWRAMILLVKAKFESINSGIRSVEQEFWSDVVMPNGNTLIEESKAQVKKALEGREPFKLSYGG